MHRTQAQDDSAAMAAVSARRRQARLIAWAVVFFSCVLLLDGLFGDRGLARGIRARQERRAALENLDHLRFENAALREEVRRLQGDPATLEADARRELGLIRPGEILILLKDRQ
jgi:cell division protein FtsB